MGPGAGAIVNLVPEFRPAGFAEPERSKTETETSVSGSSSQAPELERFQLFDSITNFLRDFAVDTPLMIVLDDVHSADVDSLLLLRFLARDLRSARIMLVATYRESEVSLEPRLTELVNDIHREGDRIVIRGLSEADITEFVERTAGVRLDPRTVAALHSATEGNPFFLNETIRLLISEGRLGSEIAPPSITNFEIPLGVRSTIRRRVNLVSEAARETLALASAIGREFDLPTLRQLSTLADQKLHAALDEMVTSGLLGTVGHPVARYRYSHALVCETLYSDLPADSRQRLHLKIAETLERLPPTGEKPHFAQVAHHYIRALPAGPVDKALEYSRRGAEQALAVHAYEEAVRLYRAMLDVLPLLAPPDEQLRFEATLSLGDAMNRAGLFNQCRQTFEKAAEIARRLGRPDDLTRAALGRGMPITDAGVIDRALVGLLEEALGAVESDDYGRRAMLMSRLAHELYWSDESERVTALAREAIDIARRLGDIPTLIYVLHYSYLSLWVPENLQERFAAFEELISLAQKNRSNHWTLRGRQLRFVSLLEMGEIEAAREELAAFRDLAAQLQQPHGILELCEASIALLEGRLDETRQIAEGALAIGESLEGRTGQFRQTVSVIEFMLRWQEGRLGELHQVFKDIADRSSNSPFRVTDVFAARCALALCYCEGGNKADAQIQFDRLAADNFGSIPRKMAWIGCIVLLAEVCAQLGDGGRAAVLYELLAPHASQNLLLTWHVSFGSAQHYLGRLAATMSRFDRAVEHFEAAMPFNQRMGSRLWIVHNQFYCAETLLTRNRPGDRERAQSLLRECLDTSSELGIALIKLKSQAALGIPERNNLNDRGGIPASVDNEFHREGDFWTIRYQGRTFRLKDIKGLSYIARLLASPGVEFHALDLVGVGEFPMPAEDPQTIRRIVLEREDLHVGLSDDSGEMLDAQSKAAYKRRLDDLRDELEDAQEFGDADRAAGLQEEIDAIARELRRAIGLGGRDRRAGSAAERARLNVTRAVRAAIDRVGRNDPDLEQLFNKSIKTGTFCCYLPDPGVTMSWRL